VRAVALAALSAVARVPGFLIPVLVAATYGAGPHTDAYFVAYGAALLAAGTLAQSVEVAIVPFAARAILTRGAAARGFFDRSAGALTATSALLWLAVVPVVTLATTAGLRGDVLRYAASFTPLVLLWCGSAVYAGGHVSQSRIATATGSTLWRGAGGLAALAVLPAGTGLWAVGLGLGLGELCRVLWLRRRMWTKTPLGGWGGEGARVADGPNSSLARATAAVMFGSSMGTAAPVLEKLMAVSLAAGAASHLEYAYRLLAIPAVLFDGALAPMLLARWSQAVAATGRPPAAAELWRPVGKGLGLAGAIGLTTALLAPGLVHVLLLHGRFRPEDAATVSRVLQGLSIGFVATMATLLLERFYIAAARTGTIATYSSLRAAVRVLVALVLLRRLGILAFVIGYAVAEWGYLAALTARARPALSATPAPAAPVPGSPETA